MILSAIIGEHLSVMILCLSSLSYLLDKGKYPTNQKMSLELQKHS